MVAPLIIGGALAAGGLAGSLLDKKSVPKYDPSLANNLAQQGAQSETNAIGEYGTRQAGVENKFQTGINTTGAAAQQQSRGAASDYLQNFDPITSRIVQDRTDALKRQTLGAVPEAVQAAREAGAAGGGLDRGVTQNALAQIPMQQARQFNEGAASIQSQALQGQLDARSKVFDSSNQLILSKLGIDANSANAILNSGNQALIQQLNDVIDSSRNSIGIQLNADAAAQNSSIGAAQNENANKQSMYNGLMGVGGAIAGSNGGSSAPVTAAASNASQFPQGSSQMNTPLAYQPKPLFPGYQPSRLSLR